MRSKTIPRILMGFIIGIVLFVVLVIIFISPIAKYVIQHYSEKWTGRKIRVGWVYINPFTGAADLHGLKIYEYQSDSIFFSADVASAHFAIHKLLSKTYEITNLTLDRPYSIVRQDHDYFNFNDLIEKFSSKTPPDTTKSKSPAKFSLLNIRINDGYFRYKERSIPVNYFIKRVNISSSGLRWDVASISGKFSLQNGPGKGDINGTFSINLKNLDYRTSVAIKDFDLQILEQYLHDFSSYGSFSAFLDAKINAIGNLSDSLDVNANGFLAVSDFHFGKRPGEDYASFTRLALDMTEVDPKHFKYVLDSVMLDAPFFKYEHYDHLDNLQQMFGEGGSKYTAVKEDQTKFNLIVEIAKYIQELATNFLKSYYKINKVAIYNGNMAFNDFAPREEFSIAANPLYFIADSIDKNYPWMNLALNTGILPYGDIHIGIKISPKDYSNFNIAYNLQKVSAAGFNPYLISYTSFPLDRGVIALEGNWNVKDSVINSLNHLLITDPQHGKKLKRKDTKWLPLPLMLSIVKSPSSVIDFEIPIKGNLNDPHFKWNDVILSVLRNLFVKPPLTPYLIHTKEVEEKEEKFLTLTWQIRQSELGPGESKFMKDIASFLEKNPNGSLSVEPTFFTRKEKEYILFFEAKRKFVMGNISGSLNREDSIRIEKMSIKDSAFVKFLDKHVQDSLAFTIQEKCRKYLGDEVVNQYFKKLTKAREREFMSYFDSSAIKQIKFAATQNSVPFNGFSYYKLSYSGDIPPKLMKAYWDMNNLDNAPPRDRYKRERNKEKSLAD